VQLSKDEETLKEAVAGLQASLELQDGKYANVPGMIMPVRPSRFLCPMSRRLLGVHEHTGISVQPTVADKMVDLDMNARPGIDLEYI
jgi:hypothetical protein